MSDGHGQLLPIANIGRMMKKILPPSAKVSREAKERMQECASEFISFVTGEASDRCHKDNRKTVNGDDVCWALSSVGFDNYSEAMLRYLQKLREFQIQRERANNQTTNDNIANSNNIEDKDEESSSSGDIIITTSFDFGILEKGGTSSAKPS